MYNLYEPGYVSSSFCIFCPWCLSVYERITHRRVIYVKTRYSSGHLKVISPADDRFIRLRYFNEKKDSDNPISPRAGKYLLTNYGIGDGFGVESPHAGGQILFMLTILYF